MAGSAQGQIPAVLGRPYQVTARGVETGIFFSLPMTAQNCAATVARSSQMRRAVPETVSGLCISREL